MHVVCNTPGAGSVIDGKIFVPVDFNDRHYERVSEDLSESDARRLLLIPGFEMFRGDGKVVDDAIMAHQLSRVEDVQSGDPNLRRQVEELQNCCDLLSAQLRDAKVLLDEREQEIARLKALIGEPSMKWTRDRLAEFAESIGLVVNEAQNKQEIFESISARLLNEGAPEAEL
jgi:hypothetical protein